MAIPALSRRASVRLPSPRFQPLLSEPGVPISGTGLSSGIMRLVHEPPLPFGHLVGRILRHRLRPLHGFPLCIPSRVRRAVEPVHASTTSNLYGSTPSLMHVMFPESLPLTRGLRQRHSRRPSSFQHPSTPEAPFLDRNYPASSVVRASPPPWRPGLPLTGFRLTRAHHRQGFPCCVLFPLPCMPAPIPRRERSVPLSLSSRPPSVFPFSTQGRLPHCPFRGLLGVHSHSGLHVR